MKNELKNQIQVIINTENIDDGQLASRLRKVLYEFETEKRSIGESKSLGELLSERILDLKNNEVPENITKSGFTNLDQIIGGFIPGELVILGGRPGMGKTQLLINLAVNLSPYFPVIFYTYDLSEHALVTRFISCLTAISSDKLRNHKVNDEEMEKLNVLSRNIKEYNIYVHDTCNSSISFFKANCQQQIEEKGAKVIIVDYLQMMSSGKFRYNREAEISLISRELKNIAKDHNVCVIAASQLSRNVESRGGSKTPHLSDLRDSGALEHDADKVLFLYRPDYYNITQDEDGNNLAGVAELIVAKNRNGRLGTAMLKVNGEFTNFSDLDNYTEDFTFSTDRLPELDPPF